MEPVALVRQDPVSVVVRLPLRFDVSAVEAARPRLLQLAADDASDLVLDGSDVEEVCSRALGLLVALRHRTISRGGSFLIDRPSAPLSRSIAASGLTARLLGEGAPPLQWRASWTVASTANA